MLNLAEEIQDARLRYEALAMRFNRAAAELNEKAPFLSPAHYFAATSEIREQLIAIQKEIEDTLAYIDRSADLAD